MSSSSELDVFDPDLLVAVGCGDDVGTLLSSDFEVFDPELLASVGLGDAVGTSSSLLREILSRRIPFSFRFFSSRRFPPWMSMSIRLGLL